ncbi:hypothetical protein LTR27_012319 [Elasticomyces elasticus]|nr:hypothetical protein LTR27_012319 [Elasticomyces elasticus]
MASGFLRETLPRRLCYWYPIPRHATHVSREPGRFFSTSIIRAGWKPVATGMEVFRGLELQKQLVAKTADPAATLRERLQAGTADLETARVCLDVYYEQLRKTSRIQRRQRIRDDDIGRLALTWLWSEDRRWVRAITSDILSLRRICYFVVAESLDDSLVEWLAQPLPPLALGGSELRDSNQWRGVVLRLIVENHLFLDCDHRADEAIERFFSVVDRIVVARREPRPSEGHTGLASVSLWPSQVAISKELVTGTYYNTNPDLYDRFVKFVGKDGHQTEYSSAQLALVHPTRPNAQPALSYVRTHMGALTQTDVEELFPRGSSVRRSMYFFLRKVNDAMLRQKRTGDSDFLEQVVQNMFDQRELADLDAKYQREVALIKRGYR